MQDLSRQADAEAVRLGFVTDIHWHPQRDRTSGFWHNSYDFAGVPERLGRALEIIAARQVDLVVLGGDLAHLGDRESQREVLELAASGAAPAVTVAGNHDVTVALDALEGALAPGGADLLGSAGVECGGLRVSGVELAEMDGWFGARTRAGIDTAAWGAGAAVLVSHYPVLSCSQFLSERSFPYPGDLLDRAEVAAQLAARPAPTVVLSGHIHARITSTEGPVLQFTQGALVEPQFECSVIEIGVGPEATVRATRESLSLGSAPMAREPSFSPDHESWTFDGMRWRARQPQETDLDGLLPVP